MSDWIYWLAQEEAKRARYTVGAAQGDISLGGANGKAIQVFDEVGASLGVIPLLAFSVNP